MNVKIYCTAANVTIKSHTARFMYRIPKVVPKTKI